MRGTADSASVKGLAFFFFLNQDFLLSGFYFQKVVVVCCRCFLSECLPRVWQNRVELYVALWQIGLPSDGPAGGGVNPEGYAFRAEVTQSPWDTHVHVLGGVA